MAGITAYQREIGWSIRILDSHTMGRFAAFYRQTDFVTMADIRRELDLGFELQEDTSRPAIVPINGGLIVSLEKDYPAAFPTPPLGQQGTYYFVSTTRAVAAQYRAGFSRGLVTDEDEFWQRGIMVNTERLKRAQGVIEALQMLTDILHVHADAHLLWERRYHGGHWPRAPH
ncbi:hypothetical protein F5883DRAFT_530100 [Diaporthe sp. PMI_573]|nr:hypothetical protein F5883DRAFT_530100 [Diaporthaceae sp. PMI_573]